MKMFFGLIAQLGVVLGQVNPEDFNDIAQVRFFMVRKKVLFGLKKEIVIYAQQVPILKIEASTLRKGESWT